MSARRAAAALCLLFARPLVADGGRAAEVAAWLTGTFELKGRGSEGAPEAVRVVVVSVPKSRIANGALVLYRELAAAPKLDEPSEQRFYRLEEAGDTVRMRAFDPKDSILVRGKWRDPSALALYGASDVREKPGCTMVLKKKGDLWEGETPGTDCPSTVKTAATMTSTLILAQDGFTLWDRRFDEKGRQVWTSPEGGMRFLKRSMNAPVDEKLIERPVGKRTERPAIDLLGTPTEGTAPRRVLASAVLVVTGRDGSAAVFSVDEVLATDGPELDLKDVPSLISSRSPGRAVRDVVSIELKKLASSPRQP